MEKRGSLVNTQIALFVIAAFVSYHIMDLPKDMVEYCNTGGWVTLILLGIMSCFFIKAMIYMAQNHEGEIITDYIHKLTSVNTARLICFSSGMFYFFYTCKKVRVCSEIVKYTVLPNTDHSLSMMLLVFLVFYGLNKGFANIVRASEISTIITTITFLMLNVFFLHEVDIYNIRPLFVLRDAPLYFKGVFHLYNRFLGFDVLLMIPIYHKINKDIEKTMYKVVLFLVVSYIFICEVCIGIIGLYDIGNYDGVFFVTSRIVAIEGMDFLRRLDGFIYFAFFLKIFASIMIYSYISTTYLKGFIRLTFKKLLKIKQAPLIMNVSFAVICYFVSFATDNLREASYYLQFLSYVLLFFTTVVPLFLFYKFWYRKTLLSDKYDEPLTERGENNAQTSRD